MFRTKVIARIKTYKLHSITFFPENRAFYEIMWKNALQRGRRIACWITKATHTHSEYAMLITFPLQQWLQERSSKLRLYVHCLSCCNRHGVCLLRGTIRVHVGL